MKKFLSVILTFVMVFSMTSTAFAADTSNRDLSLSNAETTIIELNSSDVYIKVTYTEDSFGNISMFEYHNGELYEMTRFTPGNTYYERSFVRQENSRSNLLASNNWEIVDFSDTVTSSPAMHTASTKSTRNLGYMHYNNQIIGEIYSIFCYVNEWYNSDKTVTMYGTLGSAIDVATWLVGAIGLPAAISGGVVTSLVYAGVLTLVNKILKALVSTDVTANVVEQRIYGNCTSHSGKPQGDLGDASITYVTTNSPKYAGRTFYSGYTTHMWGTGELGRMMFWKVFGVEYTPTSWTGV